MSSSTVVVSTTVAQKENHPSTEESDKPLPTKKGNFLWWQFETEIKWMNILIIAVLHALCFYGIVTFDYTNIKLLTYYIIGYIISGSGGTLGAHRLWSHKSFKAKLPLRIILVLSYASAGQNRIIDWVRDHRVHHKYSETYADPHDTRRGFLFAHVGWVMLKKRPEVTIKGQEFDFTDLYKDPLVAFHDKYFTWVKIVCCYVVPTLIPMVLWNEPFTTSFLCTIIRQVTVLHGTFSLNSFCHFFGTKPFDKKIRPTNNWFVSFVTLGDGSHNYHHTFPFDYRVHGSFGGSMTTLMIHTYKSLGWAYDLRTATPTIVEETAKKYGDGTHIEWNQHISVERAKVDEKKIM